MPDHFDGFTKKSIVIVVDHGFSKLYVARVLDQAARFRGYPKAVRTDQGPEFTSRVLNQGAYAKGVTLKLIQAGKPTQNAYIESFNGKFRDKCLNEHWFTTLAQARAVISAWRQDYAEGSPRGAMKPGRIAHWNTFARQNSLPGTEQHRTLLPLRSLLEWDYARTELARMKGAGQMRPLASTEAK